MQQFADYTVLDFGKVIGSIILLFGVLYSSSKLAKHYNLAPELSRKIVHISLGLYCLTFPWILADVWLVTLTCALAFIALLVFRIFKNDAIGAGLHGVARDSYGELLFATSVALLYWTKDGHTLAISDGDMAPDIGPILYILPLLILTLCDAASALVGTSYGRRVFSIESGKKSWEGVVTFAVVGWLISMVAFLLFTEVGRVEVVMISLMVGIFGALLEAASWKGFDNLFIPIGLQILLQAAVVMPPIELLIYVFTFFSALLIALKLASTYRNYWHFIIVTAVFFLLIATFSSIESILTPALVTLAYLYAVRFMPTGKPPHDPLNLLLAMILSAIGYFCLSQAISANTIFSYNITFAALCVGVLARYGAPLWQVSFGIFIALAALSVRTILIEGLRLETIQFMGAGLVVILIVGGVGWAYRLSPTGRPWITLGTVSFALGVITLPISP